MISSVQKAEFSQHFPFIQQTSSDFVDTFFEQAQLVELPAGSTILEEGQSCANLVLVTNGIGRVYKLSPSGREVTLYRIHAGESCVLTASCIMNQDSFPAMAEVEQSIRGLMVSPRNVREWFCRDPEWQRFIFCLLSHRLASIIQVVEEVAFKRIDVRLAEQFVRGMQQSGDQMIKKTHAELAADVGSSREVVSRILRDFSQRDLISSGRGFIEILDKPSIEALARQ
jgi:CRP/FNR family transcriptional regulator